MSFDLLYKKKFWQKNPALDSIAVDNTISFFNPLLLWIQCSLIEFEVFMDSWFPLKASVTPLAFEGFPDDLLLTHVNVLNLSTVQFTSWIKNNKGVLC